MSIINQIVKKKFYLDDAFSIEIERDINEKRVWLITEQTQVYKWMATYSEEGRWIFPNVDVADQFLKLANKFPAIRNNIHKEMLLPHEIGMERVFTCLKRKWHVRIVRTKHKLKHII